MVNQQFATAVHVLTALAFNPNQLLSSESLALSVNTNPVVIRRLLALLTKAQLVQTIRGKSGGVQLNKKPESITLKEVYVALSPTESIAPRNKSPHKECPVSCAMHSIMSQISEGAHNSVIHYLESQKLSDLIRKIPQKNFKAKND